MTTTTALQILAKTIKDAGFSAKVLTEYKCVKVALKNAKVFSYQIDRVLCDAGMEDLYTINSACGSVFVRPVIG
jgi:hypothetical protein